MLQEEKWLTSWWLTWLTIMGMFVSHCFYLYQITAWPLHKCTNLISPLRHRPTKAIREDYARGIVMLFPSLKDPYSKKGYVIGIIIVNSFMSCCDTKLCGWHWYLNSVRFLMSLVWQRIYFFHFRNTSMMLQAAQDTFLGVWKQSRGRFVEDLHCHQIAQLTFLQGAQISKGLLMLKGSLMVVLAKRPCLCSTIPQTIPWFSRRWERPFSTVRSSLMTQAEVLISSPASQDSWIQKDW